MPWLRETGAIRRRLSRPIPRRTVRLLREPERLESPRLSEPLHRAGRDESAGEPAAGGLVRGAADGGAPEIPFRRALVLFRRGRELDAGSALREAMDAFPKVIGYLIPELRRRPTLEPGRVTYGGDDEAWRYREDMRAAWVATPGAIEWLKRVRRRPPTWCKCGRGRSEESVFGTDFETAITFVPALSQPKRFP